MVINHLLTGMILQVVVRWLDDFKNMGLAQYGSVFFGGLSLIPLLETVQLGTFYLLKIGPKIRTQKEISSNTVFASSTGSLTILNHLTPCRIAGQRYWPAKRRQWHYRIQSSKNYAYVTWRCLKSSLNGKVWLLFNLRGFKTFQSILGPYCSK